jgi:hypothetical protein
MSELRFKVGDVVADNGGLVGAIERVHPGENFPYRIREADGRLGSYSDYPTLRLAGLGDVHQRPSTHDPVNHPKHYTNHPSGIECIQVTEHMGFNLGNAIKYVWRADLKADALEDLRKAVWYIEREIQKRENAK